MEDMGLGYALPYDPNNLDEVIVAMEGMLNGFESAAKEAFSLEKYVSIIITCETIRSAIKFLRILQAEKTNITQGDISQN